MTKLLIGIVGLGIFTTLLVATPSVLWNTSFAQDPFAFGNTGNPFAVGGGSSSSSGGTNVTLQVRSDTDWSGSYGSGSGSSSVDGQGNKDIKFSCDTSYSANFQKKSTGHRTLTLNIVQNQSNPAYEHAINNYNASVNGGNYTVFLNSMQHRYPQYALQITNTRTTIAEFGTVSVDGTC
jgi:hypothetical protein